MSKDYKTASEENTDDESSTIILPSVYAVHITRKQNEIIKYYENGSIDITKLEKLQEDHAKKITRFENACDKEMAKDSTEEEKNDLLKYRKKERK